MGSIGRRPLKVGLFLTAFDQPWSDAPAPGWDECLARAKRAEAIGFDSVWVPDHLLVRDPDEGPLGVWEGWSLLAALAASTERVELGPLVACAGFRNPALLAKMAETVDEISGGRLTLGLGAGWHEPEFQAFGYPFDRRVSRFEEAVTIIHGLLKDGQIDFDGTYYQARDCELRPRGPRPAGPPIMIGGAGARVLKLTARFADIGVDCRRVRRPALRPRTGGVGRTNRVAGSPGRVAAGLRPSRVQPLQLWLEPATIASIEAFGPVLELLDGG